ncbi:MAG: 1-acyl-sn-glycerol-3-phosphate acyltransferase, partial [Chloroflexota bacterium]|nr:1-acyl-sn-glycerol-3-phosphate acyltransferase [Chloroflexota bacterium]
VVAAAADYWFKRPLLGNIVSLFLNTFPFSRTGGAQAQLHSSSQLLKSGWNLVLFPEGSRSPDGRIQEFKAGVGHLANETGTPVVPMHIRGAYQVMPRGQKLPLPGPVRVRIGKPMAPETDEGSRQFTARVEKAVRALALEPPQPDIQGTWIERWQAKKPRELRYEESIEPAPTQLEPKMLAPVISAAPPPRSEKPGGRARSAAKTPRASRQKPR